MELSKQPRQKPLNIFGLMMINVIAIISLRNLPANAIAGVSIVFYYLIAALVFLLPCALITAQYATHRPETGGAYIWVKEAFGAKWGFFNIWLQWIYNIFWYPTILAFMVTNIAYLLDPTLANHRLFMLPVMLVIFTSATLINWFGMKISSVVSMISAIIGTLMPMILIIGLGIIWLYTKKNNHVDNIPFHISMIFDGGHLSFLVIIFFSLMGLEMSAIHAGDVKNPQKDYPRALLFSGIMIVTTIVLASLAIAIVVPSQQLSIIGGLNQAYDVFLSYFHLERWLPITIALITLGGFGSIAAWVIGPPKSLMVAVKDMNFPKFIGYQNNRGVPIFILCIQLIIVYLLSFALVLFPSFSAWYWLLSNLTAQLALVFYIVLFAAAIRLHYKIPTHEKAFRIPGGAVGIWLTASIGIISCFIAILVGFLPPSQFIFHPVWLYEFILLGSIILFCLLPFFFAPLTSIKPITDNYN